MKNDFREGMNALTDHQAKQLIEHSLANLLPRASELTYSKFCSDCPHRREGCFPCRSAQTMLRVYLNVLVRGQAIFN